MATGASWQPGGVVAPADVMDAGAFEWGRLTGMEPYDPVMQGAPTVGGAAMQPYDVDRAHSRIATLPPSQKADAGSTAEVFDDWRDAFDYRSPAFWVLLLILAAIGLVQLRIAAGGRVGPAQAGAAGQLG